MCLQNCEEAAEDVAACESQKGALRLDRILGKEKNRRDEIGKANDRLHNGNKDVNPSGPDARERHDHGEHDGQNDYNRESDPALLSACWHARNKGRRVFAVVGS
jgi:hypothetical protein